MNKYFTKIDATPEIFPNGKASLRLNFELYVYPANGFSKHITFRIIPPTIGRDLWEFYYTYGVKPNMNSQTNSLRSIGENIMFLVELRSLTMPCNIRIIDMLNGNTITIDDFSEENIALTILELS